MPKPPRRNARAKALVRLYTKLRREYEQRKHRRISRLRKLYRQLRVTSANNLSLSSLSSLSSSESSLNSTGGDTTNLEDEGTASEDSWADILGSDWQGRGLLGSDTSLDSELGVNDSDIPDLVSIATRIPPLLDMVVMENQVLAVIQKDWMTSGQTKMWKVNLVETAGHG